MDLLDVCLLDKKRAREKAQVLSARFTCSRCEWTRRGMSPTDDADAAAAARGRHPTTGDQFPAVDRRHAIHELGLLAMLRRGKFVGRTFDPEASFISWKDELELPLEPVGHSRVVDGPRLLERLVLLPIALLAIEKLEPVAFDL